MLFFWSGFFEGIGFFFNILEEIDDVDNFNFDVFFFVSVVFWVGFVILFFFIENGEGRLWVIMGREVDFFFEVCIGLEFFKDVIEILW